MNLWNNELSLYVHTCLELIKCPICTWIDLETVVEVWKGSWEEEMGNVTKMEYNALLLTPWYLNLAQNSYQRNWKTYYALEPLNLTEYIVF